MNVVLLVSGGKGLRMGSLIPKQYIKIDSQMIITRCLLNLLSHNALNAFQIVAEEKWRKIIIDELKRIDCPIEKIKGFSNPGKNRQLSIFNGLKDIHQYANTEDVVIIHDAVRPLVSHEQISKSLLAIQGHEGVMPSLPMKDTVYLSKDGKNVDKLLDRSQIFAGQAPEFFKFEKYFEANKRLFPKKILTINGSTEPAVLADMDIVMIEGDEGNFKITTPGDLNRYKEIVERNKHL